MWREIKTEDELRQFLNSVYDFHDSCLKELKYISGAFVEDNLAMYPVNDRRILRVIIQRQFEDNPMLELEFNGLKFLNLAPVREDYTCEILGSALFLRDGLFYWYDDDCLTETDLERVDLNRFMGTIVCASGLRWRPIENHMGPDAYYQERDRGSSLV